MTLQEISKAYRAAEAAYDLDGCAACLMQMMKMVQARPELGAAPEIQYLDDGRLKVLLAAALLAYERGDDRLAAYDLQYFSPEIMEKPAWLPEYHYLLGGIAMRRGAFAEAKERFLAHTEAFPTDERGWLALGNACFYLGEAAAAAQAYARALARHPGMREAEENQRRVLRRMLASPSAERCSPVPLDRSPVLPVAAEDWEVVRHIPVFINCRDRVVCLSKLVSWLLQAGYENLILLDNASTYAPLLRYYEEMRSSAVRIVRLGENLGHEALWKSGILDLLEIKTPYVYTDPDVLPEADCPPRFLQAFVRVLAAHPAIRKVGAALRYDDITFEGHERMQAWERTLWHVPVAKDVYFANVDTTFALYRNERSYHLGPALRLGGPYVFRHLPWYYEEAHLPEDEAYYRAHANASSTLTTLTQGKA